MSAKTAEDTTKALDASGNPLGGRKPTDAVSAVPKVAEGLPKVGGALGEAPGGPPTDEEKSSLKIKIHLDIDVEVHLKARVKGDVVIGLL